MRAAIIRAYGGPEAIEVAELPDPEPGPGELLVNVTAAGVNFVDVYNRTGAYPGELPLRLGTEAAGTVAAVGEGVVGVDAGDRVAWAMLPGAYATRAVVPAARHTYLAAALLGAIAVIACHWLRQAPHRGGRAVDAKADRVAA